jgi:hypothetical protein
MLAQRVTHSTALVVDEGDEPVDDDTPVVIRKP